MRRVLRSVLLALLFSLAAGFAFGTCLRLEAERPTVYIGRAAPPFPGIVISGMDIVHLGYETQSPGR